MDKLVLEAKELLLLASQLGACNFYGVSDPFFGMSRDEVWGEIPRLQQQLEEKQLVSFGFDGTVDINTEVQDIVSTCALCDRYITLDAISSGQSHPKRFFYMREENSAEMLQRDGDITLFWQSSEKFVDSIVETTVAGIEQYESTDDAVHIPRDVLSEASSALDKASQVLRDCGCSTKMADVISQGLNRIGGYYMVTAIDVLRNSISDFVCVSGKDGLVQFSVSQERENAWKASWIGKNEVKELLCRMVMRHNQLGD